MSPRPSEFARFGDFALFLVGALMVAAGVFVVADSASQVALYLLGTGLMVIGALLPRLSGTIKISPGSVELTVIQQLEATRREAEQRIPDRVEEAVGLAFSRLIDSGALAGVAAETPAPPPPPAPAARAGGRRRVVPVVAVLVLLLGFVSSALLWGARDEGVGAAPPGAPALADSPVTPLVLLAVAATVSAAAIILYVRVRRRRRVDPSSSTERAELFARRIVAEMTARTD